MLLFAQLAVVVAIDTVATVLIRGLSTFTLVWLWLVPVLTIAYISQVRRILKKPNVAAAGADWYSSGGRRVRTYELAEVKVIKRDRSEYLRLTDSDGHTMEVSYRYIRGNRLIWDLVFNGILHSVVNGRAKTNARLHTTLGLQYAIP